MGADIKISEVDFAVHRLLKESTSQIDLALKYINKCKVDEGEEVVEQE